MPLKRKTAQKQKKRRVTKRVPVGKIATALRLLGGLGGSTLGGMVAGPAGHRVGKHLGTKAGAFISRITGHGDYNITNASIVKRNTLISNTTSPTFALAKEGIRVAHREFITDVVINNTAFSSQSFPINPGQSITFPWLSNIAQNFQQYVINGLIIEYKSTSAQLYSSTNTAMGTVIMSFAYDPSQVPFTSKQAQLNADWAVDVRPDLSTMAALECARNSNPFTELLVRADALLPPNNIQVYDMASFQISTVGSQVANTIGELYITYDITLKKPIMSPFLGRFTHYALTNSYLPAHALGSDSLPPTSMLGSNFPLTFLVDLSTFIFPTTIESGNFLLIYTCVTHSGLTLQAPNIVCLSNATPFSYLSPGYNNIYSTSNPSTTASDLVSMTAVSITGPGATFQITNGQLDITKTVGGDLMVVPLPSTLGN